MEKFERMQAESMKVLNTMLQTHANVSENHLGERVSWLNIIVIIKKIKIEQTYLLKFPWFQKKYIPCTVIFPFILRKNNLHSVMIYYSFLFFHSTKVISFLQYEIVRLYSQEGTCLNYWIG